MWRRKKLLAVIGLLLLGGFILLYPWRSVRGVAEAPVILTFTVVDWKTGEPIRGASIALHDEAGRVVILSTDEKGVAQSTQTCTASFHSDDNPLTGLRRSRRGPSPHCRLQVVITAGGYRPREPWWLGNDVLDAEDRGNAFYVTVPVSLVPHGTTP